VAWLSRLQEAQVKYKDAVKQTQNSISSDDSNTRRSRRSSSNVTTHNNDNVAATTTTATTTRCGRAASSPRDSRVSLTQPSVGGGHRLSLRTGQRQRSVVPSASLNSAFWSSTSSDRRSTTSSLQSVFAGAAAYGKAVISRTSSVGPPAGLTMRGIQEEDTEFWQLLQHQQTTGDDADREGPMGMARRAGYRSPARLQVLVRASLSRSCPCLSLAAMRPQRDGE